VQALLISIRRRRCANEAVQHLLPHANHVGACRQVARGRSGCVRSSDRPAGADSTDGESVGIGPGRARARHRHGALKPGLPLEPELPAINPITSLTAPPLWIVSMPLAETPTVRLFAAAPAAPTTVAWGVTVSMDTLSALVGTALRDQLPATSR